MYLHLIWINDLHVFGSINNRERDCKRENILWNNLGQPAYTGHVRYATERVRYERDYKNRSTPSAQTSLIFFQATQPSSSSSPRATEDFTNKREREREIALEKACIKIKGLRI